MGNEAAIQALERRLADMERKGNALVEVINDLRQEDGLPPRPPFGGSGGMPDSSAGSVSLSQIQPDTFYGKKMQTAVREFLEMRRAANLGPATPREIFDAITEGGYEFTAKTDDIALVGMRAMLRKRTNVFHKLPNGTYGMASWYPDAKKPKAAAPDGDDDNDDENGEDEADTETTAHQDDDAAVA